MRMAIGFLWSVLIFGAAHSESRADDFCAVTVEVASIDGRPISSTWVELDDAEGKTVWRKQMAGPTFTVCDFGFGPHTLRVGTNECLPKAVSNLHIVLGRPIHIHVILDGCPYGDTQRNTCLLYFRVVDTDGNPVPGAEFSPPLVANTPPITDAFGRYQSLFHGNYDVVFHKSGFQPTTLHVQCRQDEEVEQQVLMKRAE